jgi:hypothetical protein
MKLIPQNVLATNKYINKYAISLTIKEMQVKMTLIFNLTIVRMAIITKTSSNKDWQGCGGGEGRTLSMLLVGR